MSSPASSSSASEAEAPSGATATKAAAAAALLLWERAWSLEEVRSRSQSWSLAADAGLLRFLQEFSQQTISRTHEIKKQMDRLIHETKSIDCRLHNVFNGFLMLSNMQFIENRVYDDEMDELISKTEGGDKPEQEKTREQKEADLIPKIQEAINFGLQVLDSAFEQLDIKAGNSDSEEETNEKLELILEPKDLYVDRPLPYLIGSQLFMEQDDVGLGDPSSEGSVDGDHGSLIDSEGKEEELEEFGTISDEDQKQRIVLMSDEDEDLFGDFEKGEEEEGDLEENTALKRPTSFTDELAARIKREELCKQEEEQLYMKNKAIVTVKEDVNVFSDDEDIFKPPKLTDEDFSPFGSKDGLFSGGTGLFDDERELFAELPKEEYTVEKEARIPINDGINDVFSPSSVPLEKENKRLTVSVTDKSPKLDEAPGLFDEDDNFESNKSSSVIAKSSVDFFDVDGDLFKERPDIINIAKNVAKEAKINKELTAGEKSQHSSAEGFKTLTPTPSKSQKNLFSDEEDSEDLFSTHQSIEVKNSSLSCIKIMTKTSLSLFEDEEEEELFGSVPKMPKSQAKTATLFFSSDEEDHCNNKKDVKTASEGSKKKEPMKSAYGASQTIKRGLFEEEGEDDFFITTKDSNKKIPQKTALLFEGGTLHCSPQPASTSPQPASSDAQTITVHAEQQEDFLETPQKKLVGKKAGPLEESGIRHGYNLGGGGNVLGQQSKEELFLEKDAKRKMRSIFSLFEEEEKNGVMEASKNIRMGTGKPSEKSTGVFQDEELLFSHKLQEDNDPEVDLFANKKGIPSPTAKLLSGEWLYGADDNGDDGLFSNSTTKPLVAEKKIIKKDSAISSLEKDNKVLQNNQHVKHEESKIQATEGHLEISPTDKLSGRNSTMKPPSKAPYHVPDDIKHTKVASATRNTTEMGVSFDYPMKADTLQNANKGRIKVSGKRRPPTRTARRLAVEEFNKNEMNITEDPCLPLLKGNSGPPAILYNSELHRKENTEKACVVLSANSSNQPNESKYSPLLKSTAYSDVDDLFESNNLFTKDKDSKAVLRPKATLETEGIVSQASKSEKLSAASAQYNTSCDDLFQSGKTLRKASPVPFLEDKQDVFTTSKKTVKRKERELTSQLPQVSPIHDIFEDDIFAVETVKLPVKEKMLEVNLFDDDVDIFADLAVKSKEKSTRKKMEAKSIFDEDTDDIFSSVSQSKTSVKKTTIQTVSGSKCELRTASTFEDPLNAFEGQ
ncbi:WASH complex subunit 2C isoform 3-T3 [Liasis olivaceus]